MEMEGRGFSGLYKSSSEELFLKSLIDSPIGVPLPTMDMLSFKAVSQSFRTDSEELFKRWLTNEEGYNSSSKGINSRQSQRMSSELSNLSNQQNVRVVSEGRNMQDDFSADFNQFPMGEHNDKELQSSNLFLAKAWFLSNQRMTRSRSSELRRRYAEMQNAQVAQGVESVHMLATNTTQQEDSNLNDFVHLSMCELPNQKGAFKSPSNLSSSIFNTHQLDDNTDKVSSYVNMLRDTLQLKRLSSQVEKQTVNDNSNRLFSPQDDFLQTGFSERHENWSHQNPIYVQGTSIGQVKDPAVLQTLEASINLDFDGLGNQANPIYLRSTSREPSPSESSAAAPVVSSGLDGCEGPSNSSQTLCEGSWQQVGGSTSLENRFRGFREQIMDNLKDHDQKKRSLERHASITSAISEGKENATKKRRVERSRKMAEAKERNLTPSIPLDMQVVLKRCENLEKEVRSLKLNLSFMNRKDSEQTKQIEDLQKQNEDLADEKEHLLEEIERIISKTGKGLTFVSSDA